VYMRILSVLFCAILLFQALVYAQVKDYAMEVVSILASDSLAGRGFVDDGDKKAAGFIRKEFQRFGLEPIQGFYHQPFNIPINTYPDSIFLSIDGTPLEVGSDFHVSPGSPSLSGTFEVVFIEQDEIFDLEILQQKLSASRGNILVLDEYPDSLLDTQKQNRLNQIEQFLTKHPNNPAAATILLTSRKLTWFGSQIVDANPSLRVKKELLPRDAKSITLELNNEFINSYRTQNVFGMIEGTESDSTIVMMAHYDHFGKMGQAIFPGANDNASGVAMLLNLAKYYSENPPSYSMVFIAFGAEELGLIGSKYFVDNPVIDLQNIKFMLNFDLAGTGDEGIQVVNGSVYRDRFDRLVELNQEFNLLPNVRIRGAACNSDHCNFNRKEVPGFYIYTLGGIRAYHDIYDRSETLPLTEFEDYFRLMTLFIDQF